ncbi:MAG: DUF2239 family protein [Verrucomicrobiota bacterium]
MALAPFSLTQSEFEPTTRCTAFAGPKCLATGPLTDVARSVKHAVDSGSTEEILIFDDETSCLIEVDLRGSEADVLHRLSGAKRDRGDVSVPEKRGPGRPKLGVVGREVTLLPRHWEWLDGQPGGASVALRRLVETARKSNREQDRRRRAQEAVYRFMSTMAGDMPGFEEALRAFYAGDEQRLNATVDSWPSGIREHLHKLVSMTRSGS